MNITAKIITDSINPVGVRLTTFIVKYPRFVHSEIMTHREFSRNAASSRAIPFKKLSQRVLEEPALPEVWGLNTKGMQASGRLEGEAAERAAVAWLELRDSMVKNAEFIFEEFGLHKQIVNRLIEPWMHITVLITATAYDNFFALRAHPDAQPEFQVLAYRMLHRYLSSVPRRLDWGAWHLPFGDRLEGLDTETALKVVTARAARISYLTFDGNASVEDDCRLHDQLKLSGHWSPFEHAAQAVDGPVPRSNFGAGWRQYRKMFVGENRTQVDLEKVMATRPDWVTLED